MQKQLPKRTNLGSQQAFSASVQPPNKVASVIEGIATGTPPTTISQTDAAKFVAALPQLVQNRHRIGRLYKNTCIDTRHFAFDVTSNQSVVLNQRRGTLQERMQLFQDSAGSLAFQVAAKAIANAAEQTQNSILKQDIRLVVFVTSTGFVAPGVDTELIEKLGLRRDTARVTVNFMGCAAAMNGLRVASDHVRANPTHKALLVCLELSSVNATFEDNINDVIIHSIFGDGCAAAVIGVHDPLSSTGQGKLLIREHLSYLVEDTKDGIKLGVQDNGITCKLSRNLPDYIEAGLGSVIENFLAEQSLTKKDIDLWVIHPGGTRIIQKAQSSLGLSDEQVAHSWAILRQYGNMLSAAILFVLERTLRSVDQSTTIPTKALTGLAFSFSPGVGIEGILFEKL